MERRKPVLWEILSATSHGRDGCRLQGRGFIEEGKAINEKGLRRAPQVYFFLLVLLAACVRAEAATLLTALDVLELESSFAAFDATEGEVCSFLAISAPPRREEPQGTAGR